MLASRRPGDALDLMVVNEAIRSLNEIRREETTAVIRAGAIVGLEVVLDWHIQQVGGGFSVFTSEGSINIGRLAAEIEPDVDTARDRASVQVAALAESIRETWAGSPVPLSGEPIAQKPNRVSRPHSADDAAV
jgi:hypothetical protein